MKTRIVSNKARCRECNTIVESKHRRDFCSCACGKIFVDGGTDYLRRGAQDLNLIEDLSEIEEIPDTKTS